MKIIKPGDPVKQAAIRRFSCEHCGCVFEADRTEYRDMKDCRNGHFYLHPCPTCGREVAAYPEDGVCHG